MKKLFLAAVSAAALAAAAGLAAAGGGAAAPERASAPDAQTQGTARVSCRGSRRGGPMIGFMAPVTGPAPQLGTEQRAWARFAMDSLKARHRVGWRMVEADTRLDAARASTVAQRLASTSRILAVVGPAGSQEVLASAPAFTRARVPYISASATRTTLTNGSIRGFFRVVPHDGVQAPTAARYMARNLNWRRVVVVDDQTAYGQPLADAVARELQRRGVRTSRESVRQQQTDYSALAARVPRDTQGVFLAWQVAADAQLFARQLREQGRTARIFGSDGLLQPGDFTVEGSYITFFAPDIRNVRASQPIVRGFTRRFPRQRWGTFGPPAYLAVEVAANAIRRACQNGTATRLEVRRQIARTRMRTTVLGTPLRFTLLGDVVPARFFVFQIRNGRYITVG